MITEFPVRWACTEILQVCCWFSFCHLSGSYWDLPRREYRWTWCVASEHWLVARSLCRNPLHTETRNQIENKLLHLLQFRQENFAGASLIRLRFYVLCGNLIVFLRQFFLTAKLWSPLSWCSQSVSSSSSSHLDDLCEILSKLRSTTLPGRLWDICE